MLAVMSLRPEQLTPVERVPNTGFMFTNLTSGDSRFEISSLSSLLPDDGGKFPSVGGGGGFKLLQWEHLANLSEAPRGNSKVITLLPVPGSLTNSPEDDPSSDADEDPDTEDPTAEETGRQLTSSQAPSQ